METSGKVRTKMMQKSFIHEVKKLIMTNGKMMIVSRRKEIVN